MGERVSLDTMIVPDAPRMPVLGTIDVRPRLRQRNRRGRGRGGVGRLRDGRRRWRSGWAFGLWGGACRLGVGRGRGRDLRLGIGLSVLRLVLSLILRGIRLRKQF